nr:immunoglobulin heavy chain junction region [Mus musculus]
ATYFCARSYYGSSYGHYA